MTAKESSFDLVFGIGFKIGFMFVIVGLILAYIPFIDKSVSIALTYAGFFNAFKSLPEYMQIVVAGFMFMGVAVVMNSLKGLVEDFINLLFYKEEAAKSSE